MQDYRRMASRRHVWLGIIVALIMVYPNLIYIPWHMGWPCVQEHLWLYWSFHVFRFSYFALDDWPFLWGQNEGTIAGNTQYIIFGSALKAVIEKK